MCACVQSLGDATRMMLCCQEACLIEHGKCSMRHFLAVHSADGSVGVIRNNLPRRSRTSGGEGGRSTRIWWTRTPHSSTTLWHPVMQWPGGSSARWRAQSRSLRSPRRTGLERCFRHRLLKTLLTTCVCAVSRTEHVPKGCLLGSLVVSRVNDNAV